MKTRYMHYQDRDDILDAVWKKVEEFVAPGPLADKMASEITIAVAAVLRTKRGVICT